MFSWLDLIMCTVLQNNTTKERGHLNVLFKWLIVKALSSDCRYSMPVYGVM